MRRVPFPVPFKSCSDDSAERIRMTINEIREEKQRLGWTNADLAERAGIPLSTVAKVLGGSTGHPRKATLQAMEAAIRKALPASSGIFSDRRTPAPLYQTQSIPSVVREPSLVYGTSPEKEGPHGTDHDSVPAGLSHGPGSYTVEDYLALPPEPRVELIDGRFYPMEAPSGIHQKVLFHLWKALDTCAEEHGLSCEVQGAPFDVQLFNDPYTVVQPDVMVFCSHPEEALKTRAHSAPDFIAEILSPSTAFRDRTQKLCRYRDAGVKEVWLVSPAQGKILVYRFFEGSEEPREYTFYDSVPLGISDQRCSVDFSRLLRYLPQKK